MNNHGSRKVLQWKLDIQHYNATIEHVAGVLNTPADVFRRLVEKAYGTTMTLDATRMSQQAANENNVRKRYNPHYVTPLNIATRDTEESFVLQILEHDFRNTENKLWLVQW